jgi:hypothetical protein
MSADAAEAREMGHLQIGGGLRLSEWAKRFRYPLVESLGGEVERRGKANVKRDNNWRSKG